MAREYVKDIGAVRDVSAELNDLFGNFGDQLENISVAEMKILDNAKKVVKEFADSKKYNKENRDYAEYISNKLKEDIKSVREKNGLVQEVNEHVEQQAGMYDDITDKLKEEKDILKNGIVGAFKELDNLIGGIGQNIINNLTSPMGILLTAVGFILNIFLKWNAALQEIHDSFGAFVSVGDELYNITKQQRLELIQTGANMQELLGSADNLSKAMGLTLEESVKLSGEAYKTHRELGIEVSTVESLFELQQEILGISQDELRTHTKMIGVFARQSGVAPKAVLEDIAQSSEIFAKYQGKGAESMVRAAAAAKKMGVDLSAIDQMAETIMDYETSIAAEFEFQAIFGKRIDLTNARRLIATNQMDKAFQNITDQLGDQVDLENMGYYQRQSLSKLLGMDLAQITAITNAQKEGRDATKAMATDMEAQKDAAEAMDFRDVVTPLTALQNTMENLHVLFEEEFSTMFEGMSDGIKQLTDAFTNEESPIRKFFVDVGEMFKKVFYDISEHEGGLGGYLKENIGSELSKIPQEHPWLTGIVGVGVSAWLWRKTKPLRTGIKSIRNWFRGADVVKDAVKTGKVVDDVVDAAKTTKRGVDVADAVIDSKKIITAGGVVLTAAGASSFVDVASNNKKIKQKATQEVGEVLSQEAFEKTAKKSGGKFIPGVGVLFNLGSAIYYGAQGRFDIAGMEIAGASADVVSLVGAVPTGGAALSLQAGSVAADLTSAYMIYKHEMQQANKENQEIIDAFDNVDKKKSKVTVTRNQIQYITAD